jgi:hypothetical protein
MQNICGYKYLLSFQKSVTHSDTSMMIMLYIHTQTT